MRRGVTASAPDVRPLPADVDAVRAALCFPWSQGPTDGYVNRLKAIKRSMYGWCSFELLRHRVLHDAA